MLAKSDSLINNVLQVHDRLWIHVDVEKSTGVYVRTWPEESADQRKAIGMVIRMRTEGGGSTWR